eukprot:290583-Rhodomonas_salina.1
MQVLANDFSVERRFNSALVCAFPFDARWQVNEMSDAVEVEQFMEVLGASAQRPGQLLTLGTALVRAR